MCFNINIVPQKHELDKYTRSKLDILRNVKNERKVKFNIKKRKSRFLDIILQSVFDKKNS